jgi:predicted metal-dependent phosphoesterase TrpH
MKIDLHTHSSYSNDGVFSPEKLIKSALKKGLDGIALTDHNTTAGWTEAIEVAKKLNAVLILGEELKIKKNGKTMGEILGYFIKEEINPKGKTVEQAIEEIRKQGGIAIIAHPYHWKKAFKDLEKYKNLADGIEAFNSRSQSKKENHKSIDFAKKNNLAMTAGSDCHSPFEVGDAFTESKAKNIEEFKQDILNKRVKISGRQSPFICQIYAALGKIIHFFWQSK